MPKIGLNFPTHFKKIKHTSTKKKPKTVSNNMILVTLVVVIPRADGRPESTFKNIHVVRWIFRLYKHTKQSFRFSTATTTTMTDDTKNKMHQLIYNWCINSGVVHCGHIYYFATTLVLTLSERSSTSLILCKTQF